MKNGVKNKSAALIILFSVYMEISIEDYFINEVCIES